MQLHLFLTSEENPSLPPLCVANRNLKIPVRFFQVVPSLKAEPAWLSWSLFIHRVELCWGAQRERQCCRHDLGSAGWVGRGIPSLGLVAALLPVQPSTCLVSCCKANVKCKEQITEWTGLHLCRGHHVVSLFQGTVLAWVFLSRKQH